MNKTMTISAIVLVAVIMGMSAVAPAMAFQAEPDQRPIGNPACELLTKLVEENPELEDVLAIAIKIACGGV